MFFLFNTSQYKLQDSYVLYFTTGYPNLKTSKYFNCQWISFYQSDCKDHHWIQNGCNITVCTKYLSGRARRRNIWLQVITYGPSVAKVVWCSLYFYQQQHSSPQWSQWSFSQNLCEIHLNTVSFFLVEFLVAYTVNQIPNNLNLMNLVADGYFQ